jgi:hypothetical protein
MNTSRIAVYGNNFADTGYGLCKIGNYTTTYEYATDNKIYCYAPYHSIATVMMVSVTTNGRDWIDAAMLSFLIVNDTCPAGQEYRGLSCQPCAIGYYKPLAASGMCTSCGEYMATLFPGSTNNSDCVCNGLQMSIVGDYDHCECNAGYYFGGSTCLSCATGTYKSIVGNEQCT